MVWRRQSCSTLLCGLGGFFYGYVLWYGESRAVVLYCMVFVVSSIDMCCGMEKAELKYFTVWSW